MFNFVCTTLSCLTFVSTPANVELTSNDSLIHRVNGALTYCMQKEKFYNCRATNNLFNPIDN
jgi:hypothetical protein